MTTSSSDLAAALGLAHLGDDIEIREPRTAGDPAPGSLVFVNPGRADLLDAVRTAARGGALTVIADAPIDDADGLTVLVSPRPRLDFARALERFFTEASRPEIHHTAVIDPTAVLGEDVTIGPHAVIGAGVTLADRVRVGAGTVIEHGCRIGARTVVKPNSVVGREGFGFEYDDDDRPVRMPHLGGVVVGEDAEIGALVSIARGTLGDTVIGDRVKIDDHVFIAHNVRIGDDSFVIAGAEISGSVTLGRGCWVGPQVTIRDQVTMGEHAMAGIGAVVTKDVAEMTIVAGNPARVLRTRDLSRDR